MSAADSTIVNESGLASSQRPAKQFMLKSLLVKDIQDRSHNHAAVESYQTVQTKTLKDGKEKHITEISQIAKTVCVFVKPNISRYFNFLPLSFSKH